MPSPVEIVINASPIVALVAAEAMARAVYAIMEDEDAYWGEIPGFQGVWARHITLEGCRRELREALSDWIAFRLSIGLPIPVIADLDLSRIRQPVSVVHDFAAREGAKPRS